MAYDRYDSRDQNRGYRDDRQRDYRSGGYRNNDGDDRGFFQRAADEVSSWFGDESSGGRRERDDRYGRSSDSSRRYETGSDNEQRGYTAGQGGWGSGSSSTSSYEPRAYDESDSSRRLGRDQDRSAFFGGGQSSSYGRDRDQGDYRNQYGRGAGESGGFGRGDYGRQGSDMGDYGSRSSSSSSSFGQSFDRNRDDTQSRGYQSQGGDRYRPMTGDYGRGQSDRGGGLGSQDYGQQQYGRQDRFQDQDRDMGRSSMFGGSQSSSQFGRGAHDDHYSSWRQRQIEDLDRDYDEYRREHQSRFESEFSSFRTDRQSKRQLLGQIREHAEVVDENGERIGTVDKVRGDKVILTKNDPEANGVHRSFTCSLLSKVEDGKVTLTGTKDSIRSRLQEERDEGQQGGGMMGGMFGGSDNRQQDRSASSMSTTATSTTGTTGQSSDGPHMLDKSFSGTYDDSSKTK